MNTVLQQGVLAHENSVDAEFWHGCMNWFNAGWLALDLAIIVVLIPTVILQRRESGATLAWILVIVLVPFLGLFAFWLFGTTRLHLRRRKRRSIEVRLASKLHELQTRSAPHPAEAELPPTLLKLAEKLDDTGPQGGQRSGSISPWSCSFRCC